MYLLWAVTVYTMVTALIIPSSIILVCHRARPKRKEFF
jgi:hypothetical protein